MPQNGVALLFINIQVKWFYIKWSYTVADKVLVDLQDKVSHTAQSLAIVHY